MASSILPPVVKVPVAGAPAGPSGPAAVPAAPRPVKSTADLAAELGFIDSQSETGHAMPKFGFWGAGLSGKTSHALSWPGPLVFNFDPNTSTIRGSAKRTPYVQVRDYAHMQLLIKAAENGQLTQLVRTMPGFEDYRVRTLLMDSSTFQAHMIENHLDTMSFATARGGDDTRARYQEKLRIMNRLGRSLDKAAEFKGAGKDQYTIITMIHEKIMWDEKGNITNIKADITGDYQRLIFQHQDTNFFCELVTESSDPKTGKATANTRPSAVVHTIPPTKFHNVVNDRLGGKGRYKLLPPKITVPHTGPGLYPILCNYWGIPLEEEESQ